MKRIQCEVCNGTSLIKKNDVYECQHCGVQYAIENMKKMLVEIDHSSEIDNYLKRADKFQNEGDYYEAKEYYNKALDYDATNQYANDNINRIELIEKWERYSICNRLFDANQGFNVFVNKMIGTDDVTCDIFENITILDISEKYILGIFYEFQLEYDWDAVACYSHSYEESYYVQGERRTRTKYYTTRTPVHGRDYYDGELFYLAADFTKILPECSADTSAYFRDNLEKELRIGLKRKAINYQPINSNFLSQKEGVAHYNNAPINVIYDSEHYTSKRKAQYEIIDRKADKELPKSIRRSYGASSIEGYGRTRSVYYSKEIEILIPIIYVQYLYKGKKYLAVINATQNNSIWMIYPRDEEIMSQKKKFERARKSANNYALFCITLSILLTSIGVYIYHWDHQVKPKIAEGYTYSQIINNPSFLEIKNAEYLLLFVILLTLIAFIFAVVYKIKQVKEKNAKKSVLTEAIKIRDDYKKERLESLMKSYQEYRDITDNKAYSKRKLDLAEYNKEIKPANNKQESVSMYANIGI